jgi:type II secretory ATPase GspE/PulE/Tfp pilus assembly ATPase PilB-like protein
MPDLLLTAAAYGGYISTIKFVLFLILFLSWLWSTGWVNKDAKAIGTKDAFWTILIFGIGAAATVIWLFVPVFIVGILLYIAATGAVSFGYVMHRNAKVPPAGQVLTPEHIKSLFAKKQKKQVETVESFHFITANNNDVPIPDGDDTPDYLGYKTTYDILNDAIWRRADNMEFSPTQQNYGATYYVDGVAIVRPEIARDKMEHFIRFLKLLANMEVNEKRKPQKGRFKTRKGEKYTDWEVMTAGSTAGEQVQMTRTTKIETPKLNEIGLISEQYEQLNKISESKHGLFIISGPKKSGVTTTYYAMLKKHDPYLNVVSSLEKRPLGELTNITQNIFTLSDSGTTTYGRKLQAILRFGVDIIGVADCEDTEIAQTVCGTVGEGKIAYITLEADGVVQALVKWIKLVGDKNIAVDNLLGIANQRLLRKLCDKCRQAYEPNKEILRKFNIPAEKAKVFYRAAKGQLDKYGKSVTCENCQGTGFAGRIPIFEIIIMDDELKNSVKQSKSSSEISTEFRRVKMLYLQEQALKKVLEGATAITEMVRVLSADDQKAKKQEEKT